MKESLNRTWWYVGGGVAVTLVFVAVLAFANGGAKGSTPGLFSLRLPFGGGGNASADASRGTLTAKAQGTAAANTSKPKSKKPGGKDSNGSPGGNTNDPGGNQDPSAEPTGTDPQAPVEMKVMLKFWNDTFGKPLTDCTVTLQGIGVAASYSWKPATNVKSTTKILGPLPMDRPLTVVVKADGGSGKVVEATFVLDKTLVSASERDAIHIGVSDKDVRVLGNPVMNFEVNEPRF